MNAQVKPSIRTIIFMVKLRNSLLKSKISLQSFLKTNSKNQQTINCGQFTAFAQKINPSLNLMQLAELFKQLQTKNTIVIERFIRIYEQSTKNVQIKMPEQENNNKKNQNQQIKKQVKDGLMKLYKFLREVDPEQLFNDCDLSENGTLIKKQFNKLLLASNISQFKVKRNRIFLIDYLFSKLASPQQITKTEYYHFFKLQQKQKLRHKNSDPIELINYKPLQQKQKVYSFNEQNNPKVVPFNLIADKRQHIQADKTDKLQKKVNPISMQNHQTNNQKIQPAPMKKKDKYLDVETRIIRQNEAISKIQQDNYNQNNIQQLFPNAFPYYREGLPENQEIMYLQTLEGHLEIKKYFKDSNNPKTHIGTYKSAYQFFGGSYSLFEMAASVISRQKSRIGIARHIEPKDIIQGQIGDCYFLSSIASLVSLYPELISERFLFNNNPSRMFAVKLFIDGQWVVLQTDDYFPCKYDKPCFAKPHGKQIWVMLLQKCWAKVFGSYNSIQSGTPTQGFVALTGAPCEYITADQTKQSQQKVLVALQESYKKKFVTTASGNQGLNKMSKQQQKKIGLIGNHAYSFLKLIRVNNDDLLLKMRNPWGKQVWLGKWSFGSKEWTKELRLKFNYVNPSDDGSFYISWHDFIKYFGNFVVCRVDPTLTHSTYRMSNRAHQSNYLQFTVHEPGNYFISIYQESKRKFGFIETYEFSPVRLILLKKNGQNMEYIASKNNAAHASTLQCKLEPGTYVLSAKVVWKNWKEHDCVLTSYGPQKIKFQILERGIASKFKSDMIESYSRKAEAKIKTYQKIKIPQAFSETSFSINSGLGFIRVSNFSNKQFCTTIEMKEMSGIKVIKPGKIPCKFQMKPNSTKILGFFVSHQGYDYKLSESMEYKG